MRTGQSSVAASKNGDLDQLRATLHRYRGVLAADREGSLKEQA
jgi:hypothetical protein